MNVFSHPTDWLAEPLSTLSQNIGAPEAVVFEILGEKAVLEPAQ